MRQSLHPRREFASGDGIVVPAGAREVVIENEHLVYTGDVNASVSGIVASGAVTGLKIRNCVLEGWPIGICTTGLGLKLAVSIEDVLVVDYRQHGIYLANAPGFSIEGACVTRDVDAARQTKTPAFMQHGLYAQYNSPLGIVARSLFENAPGEGIKLRGGGTVVESIVRHCPVGVFIGGGEQGEFVQDGVQAWIVHSVIEDSVHSYDDERRWSVAVANARQLLMMGNFIGGSDVTVALQEHPHHVPSVVKGRGNVLYQSGPCEVPIAGQIQPEHTITAPNWMQPLHTTEWLVAKERPTADKIATEVAWMRSGYRITL